MARGPGGSTFDTIPYETLMKCVHRRFSDGNVLTLIRMWLKAVVVESSDAQRAAENCAERKPEAGNPPVRFDGGGAERPLGRSVLYSYRLDTNKGNT